MRTSRPPAGQVSSPAVWLTGVAALTLLAGIVLYLSPLQPGPLALQFAFTAKSFGAVIHAWPEAHLLRYRAHLPYDFLLLACYGAFGYLFASRSAVFAAQPSRYRVFAMWLLPVAAAFDATENVLQWWLTAAPRFGIGWVYAISAVCSTVKWLLLFAYGLAVLYAVHRARD